MKPLLHSRRAPRGKESTARARLRRPLASRAPFSWVAALCLGISLGASAQSGFSTGATQRGVGVSAVDTSAGSALGLKPTSGQAAVITLDEAIKAALGGAPDARIAAERVIQQDAALRRTWALLLPSLSVGATYAHTCTGGENGVDCGDRTTSFANKESLEQQALLFDTLADVMGIAADAAADPEEQAEFRARQVELQDAAAGIRATDITPVVVQPASQLSGQLSLTMPIFNPRAYPALLNAYDGVDAAAYARDQARQALVIGTARAYSAALTAERLKDATQRQVELASAQKEAVAARVAASTQPILAEKRATLELLRAKQNLAAADAAYQNAIASLGVLIGREEVFVLSPLGEQGLGIAELGDDADALIARALSERLDVKTQRTMVQISERGVTDAWMQFLPSIGLTATARMTSFTQGFVRDPVTGILTLSATLPLYDGGARYAALDESTSRVNEERIRLRQLEDRVAAQVRGAVRDVGIRRDAAALAKEALSVATEAQAQAQALFDAGVGTALDVTETSVAVFAAETDAVRSELEYELAKVNLLWSVGWTALP